MSLSTESRRRGPAREIGRLTLAVPLHVGKIAAYERDSKLREN